MTDLFPVFWALAVSALAAGQLALPKWRPRFYIMAFGLFTIGAALLAVSFPGIFGEILSRIGKMTGSV